MTKTHFKEILQELRNLRTTNKFKGCEVKYCENIFPNDNREYVSIDKVDVDNLFIRFAGRTYIQHDNVMWITPDEFKQRFFVTIPTFSINSIDIK